MRRTSCIMVVFLCEFDVRTNHYFVTNKRVLSVKPNRTLALIFLLIFIEITFTFNHIISNEMRVREGNFSTVHAFQYRGPPPSKFPTVRRKEDMRVSDFFKISIYGTPKFTSRILFHCACLRKSRTTPSIQFSTVQRKEDMKVSEFCAEARFTGPKFAENLGQRVLAF